jgi:hypothetical protein
VPWNPNIPPDVRTAHLGGFTPAHVEQIAAALDDAKIAWWTKEPGFLSRLWQLGIEVFVDRDRLDDARAIVDGIVSKDR